MSEYVRNYVNMPLFLGIDGGGTKTTCVVGDERSILGTGTGSGSNVIRLGEAEARAGLHAAISQACCEAKVSPLRIQFACVGAAGAGNPKTAAVVKSTVRNILPNAEVNVVGDMVIAHEATLHSDPGVLVIAGTGSIAYGRNAAGETARAGGWGFAVSDEGSGQWIGKTAVVVALRAFDSQRPTLLMDRIMTGWNLGSRDDLVRHANSNPGPNFAELFPVVQQTAQEGDKLAIEVLSRAAAELCDLASIVIKRLWKSSERVRVGVAGGVFVNSPQVCESFQTWLHETRPLVDVSFDITEPVHGALSLARRSHQAAEAP
jgi:N-acetylglucosamine kinase-like BadF-type ATPase